LIAVSGVLRTNAYAQATPAMVQSSLDPIFDVVSIRPMKEDDNTPTHITTLPTVAPSKLSM
jgi:hypothetical protein